MRNHSWEIYVWGASAEGTDLLVCVCARVWMCVFYLVQVKAEARSFFWAALQGQSKRNECKAAAQHENRETEKQTSAIKI